MDMLGRVALLVVFAASAPWASGGEFFVSPEGSPEGDGSRERPWDLATALGHPEAVEPGDTLRLAGGTYRGGFTSRLQGAEGAPITVAPVPGERVTVDCVSDRTALFVVDGAWSVFRDFELTCSDRRRTTDQSGSSGLNRGGFHCRGSHVSFVNLVVHDTDQGFGFWSEGEGGEISGCVIYNNGWRGPDRGHGHAIYAQNRTGTKRLIDNICFNQFGYGLHVYGSEKASLDGFHIEGNVCFNNGCLADLGDRAPNILVGGGSPARRIALVENCTWHSVPATNVRLGYGAVNEDLLCHDNVFTGFCDVRWWRKATVSGNLFAGIDSLVLLEPPPGADVSGYEWDGNRYVSSRQKYAPLTLRRGETVVAGWDEWRKAGLDVNGSYEEGEPVGARILVRPNRHEPGRAHVVVFNWEGRETVEADVSEVLSEGMTYRLVDAQDVFGEPVLRGVYDGRPLEIPMKARRAPRPIGMEDFEPPAVGPEFGVFVLLPATR